MKILSRPMIATRVTLALSWALALTLTAASRQASADTVVIVSAQSSITALTAGEISRIYQGRSNTMTPLDIVAPSSARQEFYAKVVGVDDARVKASWSRLVFTGKGAAPKELTPAEIVKAVAANPKAIAYIDRSFVNMTVKIVYTVK